MLTLSGAKLRTKKSPARVIRMGQDGISPAAADRMMAAINQALPVRLADLLDVELRKAAAARDPLTKYVSAFDMFGMYQGIRERESYTTLSYQTLRRMARQCPPVTSIIQIRCNQVASFAQLPESRVDAGFRIMMRDRDAKPTAADKKRMKELEVAFLRCGLVEPDPALGEHTFEHFIRMLVRDSLTMDAMAVEVRPGKNSTKYPALRWQAVDAAEIRRVEPAVYRQNQLMEGKAAKPVLFVQWRDGQVQAEFTDSEMVYGTRNPCTDRTTLGYGISELEMMVDLVSSTLFGINYNKQYFTQSSIPPGVVSIIGSFSEEVFEGFRQQWAAQVGGPTNHWKTPLIGLREGQGVQYTPFRQSSRDMEFHLWLQFLATFICSIFSIHPEEIGIQGWSPMRAALSESNPVTRLKHSHDKGLVPLLKSVAALMNEILWKVDPNYEFVFVNLTEHDEEADIRLASQRVSYLTTVNEERRERDLEELEGDEYNTVLNPLVVQMRGQRQQAEQMEQFDLPAPEAGGGSRQDEELDGEFEGGGQDVADQRAFMFQQAMGGKLAQGRAGGKGNNGPDGRPLFRSMGEGPLVKSIDLTRPRHSAEHPQAYYIRHLDIPLRLATSLESEGLYTVADLSIPSVDELGMILEGNGLPQLVKALKKAGFVVHNRYMEAGEQDRSATEDAPDGLHLQIRGGEQEEDDICTEN